MTPQNVSALKAITPVILTLNEAPNIGRSLAKLRWARRVVVVDSGSVDDTAKICAQFPNVDFKTRTFTTHAEQWNWAVHETAIDTHWVLALDADYLLTDEFVEELQALATSNTSSNGYAASFRYCIDGRALRGSLYPDVVVLFEHVRGRYRQDGHTQRLVLDGVASRFASKILHDDRKPLASWLRSQDRYAALECAHIFETPASELSLQDKLRKLIVVAPLLVPLYCLFARGLILDGWAGIHYAMQRTIAEIILSVKLIERRLSTGR